MFRGLARVLGKRELAGASGETTERGEGGRVEDEARVRKGTKQTWLTDVLFSPTGNATIGRTKERTHSGIKKMTEGNGMRTFESKDIYMHAYARMEWRIQDGQFFLCAIYCMFVLFKQTVHLGQFLITFDLYREWVAISTGNNCFLPFFLFFVDKLGLS